MNRFNIAIDGPAGAGKSTIAKMVARKLGYIYIDTGAMYRAVALKMLDQRVDLANLRQVEAVLGDTDIYLEYDEEGAQQVFLDGVDVSREIRTPEVTGRVSAVAAISSVRGALVYLQRKMATRGGVVMDGRDIGTCVLPDAHYKFFLTASVEERARRRFMEMEQKGFIVDLEGLVADITKRDDADSTREIGPLKQAADAILINSTSMTIDQVADTILEYCLRG